MTSAFDVYAELIRQISVLRADDAARLVVGEDSARSVQAELAALEARHEEQSARLVQLAEALRQPVPHFETEAVDPVEDPRDGLRRAASAISSADAALAEAEHAARRPWLLPTMSPLGRAVTVFGASAAAGWLVQCGLYAVSTETDFGTLAWSLCGLPAIAFFAGYVVVATIGQPHLTAARLPTHVRLGGLICFVGMPVAWLFILVAFSLLGG